MDGNCKGYARGRIRAAHDYCSDSGGAGGKAQTRRAGVRLPAVWLQARDGRQDVEPETNEQATMTLIHSLRNSGHSFQAIADRLNENGIFTRSGSRWRYQYIALVINATPDRSDTTIDVSSTSVLDGHGNVATH